MTQANRSWRVLPHRPIEKVTENLWRVEGDLGSMQLKRVMTVAKLEGGGLLIHNAVALEPAAMAEIDSWGRVDYLIVPNGFHRMDAKIFQERYPAARLLCPSGARKKVEEVATVSGTYADFPPSGTVALQELDGVGQREGVLTVRSQDGVTLVVNDALFNMPHLSGVQGFLLKHVTRSTGGLRVTRLFSLALLKDRAAFRAHLERLAATPDLRRLIVSHHEMLTGDVAFALRLVASRL